ncbi:hypothetical protein SLE2022_367260 [Rubroshorea leprosula]
MHLPPKNMSPETDSAASTINHPLPPTPSVPSIIGVFSTSKTTATSQNHSPNATPDPPSLRGAPRAFGPTKSTTPSWRVPTSLPGPRNKTDPKQNHKPHN